MKTYKVGVSVTDHAFGYLTVSAENEHQAAEEAVRIVNRAPAAFFHKYSQGIFETDVEEVEVMEAKTPQSEEPLA